MKKSDYKEEQIAFVSKKAKQGTPVMALRRKFEITEHRVTSKKANTNGYYLFIRGLKTNNCTARFNSGLHYIKFSGVS